jgi:hypothetical protein
MINRHSPLFPSPPKFPNTTVHPALLTHAVRDPQGHALLLRLSSEQYLTKPATTSAHRKMMQPYSMRPLLSGSSEGPLKKRVAATTRKAKVYSVWIILIGNRPCKHQKAPLSQQ